MKYAIRLRHKTHCDRTVLTSLIGIAFLVLILFYIGSLYIPPASHNLLVQELEEPKDGFTKSQPESQPPAPDIFYGIIFDAGSTGSRIHIYCFKFREGNFIKLVNETFKSIKPGLSSFYLNPRQGVLKTIQPLINVANMTIPRQYQSKTPIALKATAGLRLLPTSAANEILAEVRALFSKYHFLFSNDDTGVSIMKGTDEGVYMWVTVNFLLGKLSAEKKQVAALDLGGGSTQVTFVPLHPKYFIKLPGHTLQKVSLFKKIYRLYSHSYLRLGIMSSRLSSMGHASTRKNTNALNNVLQSPCLPAKHIGNWTVQNTDYIIRGLEPQDSGFKNCYLHVQHHVEQRNITQLPDLNSLPVYLFSYYHDRAVDAGIISDTSDGATVTINDYRKAAEQICNHRHKPYKPFLCFDVTYIYSLLTHGFGLQPDTKLHIYRKINHVEMSWALGCMFDLLSKSHPTA